MRQIWIDRPGREEALALREAPDATATEECPLLIRVEAIGVSFADLVARKGMYTDAPSMPFVPGYEVSGVALTAAGAIAAGDRVCALTNFGGYATHVAVPSEYAFVMPERMTFEEGAAFPVNYITAYVGTRVFGNARHGDRMLIHSAGGGVGIAATQLALVAGAAVYGIASEHKHARLREMGVTACIDSRKTNVAAEVRSLTGGRGMDLILDSTGGRSARRSYSMLAPLGRLVLCGISSASKGNGRNLPALIAMALQMPRYGAISLIQNNRSVAGVNVARLWQETELLRTAFAELFELYENHRVTPMISDVVPFERASEAHRILEERRNFGKVVLRTNP